MAPKIASRYFTGKPCKRGHVSERWTKSSICIECDREHRSEYRKKNPEAHRKSSREYARRNRPEETKRQSKWYSLNKQHRAQWIREYRQQPIIKAARTAEAGKRRSQKQKACPNWVDMKLIKEIYLEARRRTQSTGTCYHVDHIIPLKHPLVCGLHVPWNLQIISAIENLKKSNRLLPDCQV